MLFPSSTLPQVMNRSIDWKSWRCRLASMEETRRSLAAWRRLKYPSCLLVLHGCVGVTIDEQASPRSELGGRNISAMIADSVSALLSVAPVSG